MADRPCPVDRAHKLLATLGWSVGDCSTYRGTWMVYAHRDDQRIVVRANAQAEAWDEALRQAGIVQREVN